MFAVALQLDREVAAIRFSDEHAQFRAEPARIAFHVRVGGQDLFGLVKLARSFGQARAGRRMKINDETALVKFGQKIGIQLPVNEHSGNQHRAAGQQREPAKSQGRAQRAFVNADDAGQQKCRRPGLLARGRAPFFRGRG